MIKELYQEVQGIVYKCRNEYYLHLWELSDWDQEGMICWLFVNCSGLKKS